MREQYRVVQSVGPPEDIDRFFLALPVSAGQNNNSRHEREAAFASRTEDDAAVLDASPSSGARRPIANRRRPACARYSSLHNEQAVPAFEPRAPKGGRGRAGGL